MEWVAFARTSEHQLGIAIDINADKNQRAQMINHIKACHKCITIMVSYYGTHKGNRRLQGQAMSHGIIDM